jgi:hypothetical protein
MLTDPNLFTPASTREELTRYGGKNKYGQPLWRLIVAEKHTVIRGGTWRDIDANDNPFLFDARGGRIALPPTVKRTRTGIMEVPLYPVTGWILEQWFPASSFGDRETWEANKDPESGYPLLGAYPSEGGYWMLGGPWKQTPPMKFLTDLIGRYEYNMNKRSDVSPEIAMQQFLEEQKRVEELELDRFTEEREYAMRHIVQPMMKSLSLEAQRFRQEVMNRCGIRSHVGVGGDS